MAAPGPAGAVAAQFEFKCSSNQSPDHPTSVRLRQMWTAVERESGGRIRRQFFPNSMLGGDETMFSQLRVGAIQFLVTGPALGAVVPASDINNVGFAFKDEADALRACDGPLGAFVRGEIEAKGMHAPRSSWDGGMREMGAASRPVKSPADLMDKLVRQGLTIDRVDQGPFRASLRAYFDYWANAFGPTAWGLLENSVGRRPS